MGLENASYIDELVPTNPDGTDAKNQGDNHIRMIKDVLKTQFPNLGSGPVTSTAENLSNGTPTGVIVMWSGSQASIPTGWNLCDGSNSTPDLSGKFIYGGSSGGATGGNNTIQLSSTASHTLTNAQIPSHAHTITNKLEEISGSGAGNLVYGNVSSSGTSETFTGTNGGNGGHSHNLSFPSNSNMPSYYTLAFIMKS